MAAAPDVASLVSRAQQLSSTPQGLDALHTALEQSADLLKTNAGEALAALESRALDPKRHALAWTHFLRAAVASTRPDRNLGERSTADGPGSLLPGTMSAPAERGVAAEGRLPGDVDVDDDADAATTEANDEGDPVSVPSERSRVFSGDARLESRDAMDVPPEGGAGAFGRDDAFAAGDDFDDGGDDYGVGDDAYDDVVDDREPLDVLSSFSPDADDTHARTLAASFPAFKSAASELLRGSDEDVAEAGASDAAREKTKPASASASAQVRRCPSAFAEVSRAFAACAFAEGKDSALAAVAPLRAATRAARPTRDHLTKQHAFLFAACAACGRHDVVADDVCSNPVFECDPSATGVDALDYLKYCELGGNAFAALGRYADAAELFLRAVTAPASAPTPAHASAHKKYVLCSLLADGACAFASSPPKYASPAVQRHVRGACASYASFAEAYVSGSVAKTRARFAESVDQFRRDGPEVARLAETAVASLTRRAIAKLTETHISSSLSDIAAIAELPGGEAEAERVVLRMVDCGEIVAKIDASTRSVAFADAADEMDPAAAEAEAAALVSAAAEARALAERVRRKDDTLRASRAYVAATADLERGLMGGKGKPEEGKLLPGDAEGDWEDE